MASVITFLRRYPPSLCLGLLGFSLLCGLLEVLSIWVLRTLFMASLGQDIPATRFLAQLPLIIFADPRSNVVFLLMLGAFIFITLKNGLFIVMWREALAQLAREQARVALNLFEHYLRVPYVVHSSRSWASLQDRIDTAAQQLFLRLVFPALLAASELVVLCGILAYLLLKSPGVTLLLIVWLAIPAYLFRVRVMRRSQLAGTGRTRSAERLLRLTHETMADFRSIKLAAAESHFLALFRDQAKALSGYLAADRLMVQMPRFVFEPILIGGLVVLYAMLFFTHSTSVGIYSALTLYAAAAVRILPAAQRLLAQIHLLAFDQSSLMTLAADLEQPMEDLPSRDKGPQPPPFREALTLENVSLTYPGGRAVLTNVNLTIQPGDKIAIVGTTGAGKTSLVNILLGFVSPTQGRVLYDGDDTPPLMRLRRSALAYVAQDAFLLDDTVIRNVAFATAPEDIDVPRIWEALRRARVDTMIRQLPDGLNTRLGENGIRFSGGERQRLALARAFYQSPTFLVLDEATSHLDPATEKAILTDLLENCPDLTVLAVTHRPETALRFGICLSVGRCTVTRTVSPSP